jgi:hypothetical protein
MAEKKEPKLSARARTAAKTLNAYRRLFSTDDGQIVLKDLMQVCNMSRSVIGRDTHETYFNEGMRAVILRIIGTTNMEQQQVERIIVEMNRQIENDVVL